MHEYHVYDHCNYLAYYKGLKAALRSFYLKTSKLPRKKKKEKRKWCKMQRYKLDQIINSLENQSRTTKIFIRDEQQKEA
jgi:hypothetical protein